MPIIQSVERALRILDLFDERAKELRITEISEKMQMNKSTIHSLLKTLQKHNYVEQDPESGKYKLGMKLFERGNFIVENLDIRTVARKHLLNLSQKTTHTAHLVVLDQKEGLYIDKVEGTSATIVYSRIGRRVPLHCSAVGKVLVAFKNEYELKEILKDFNYIQHTANTLTNETQFIKELENVRMQGYAVDNEENEHGVCCFSVPIRNHSQNVIAAVSISSPSAVLTDEEKIRLIELLKETGYEISKEMGYEHHMLV